MFMCVLKAWLGLFVAVYTNNHFFFGESMATVPEELVSQEAYQEKERRKEKKPSASLVS